MKMVTKDIEDEDDDDDDDDNNDDDDDDDEDEEDDDDYYYFYYYYCYSYSLLCITPIVYSLQFSKVTPRNGGIIFSEDYLV